MSNTDDLIMKWLKPDADAPRVDSFEAQKRAFYLKQFNQVYFDLWLLTAVTGPENN